MQDMATMQQHTATSPAPATTVGVTQDASSDPVSADDKCSPAVQQETSRTDVEMSGERPVAAETAKPVEDEDVLPKEDSVAKSNDGDGDECTGAGAGAFGCPACSATLPSQHALTLHLRSEQHRGGAGAPFPCGVCGKALSSASSRDRHALVHSRERPFQCRVCGVAFTTNGNMHRHLRTHDAAPEASPASKRRRESCGSSSSSSSGGSSRAGSTRGSSPPSPTVCNKRKVGFSSVGS
ncbi:ras-responsive element-binding protein 1-like [Schistocerca serialis cubense]|uniref:ras-responsive element-binding protein 1-like n=1 Tax=Schistocerca serialis cubense TaxID=2023355 RepID=UPI00214F28EB|nr:ras-responsive element-binding protein 1-like [Schistocerca serialis cubense]